MFGLKILFILCFIMHFRIFFAFVGILQVLIIIVLEFYLLCSGIRHWNDVDLRDTSMRKYRPRTKPVFEVCIMSARRPGNITYLGGVLRAIERQKQNIDVDMWRDVTVLDLDGIFSNDETFRGYKFIPEVNKRRIKAECVNDGLDVSSEAAGQLPCKVRQINLDVGVTLDICHRVARRAGKEWILFVEDDVNACENSFGEIQAKIREINQQTLRQNACVVLRFSKMYMAYAMHTNCVNGITEEISRQAKELPHDLVIDAMKDGNITVVVHERNLFHHEGVVSTIAYRNEKSYREKYSEMRSDYCGQPL